MFSTTIDMDVLNQIEDFMESDECNFVQNMNESGLSFGAMAFVIDSIVKAVANAKNRLNEKSED
jgi:hypothetical protein